ncbi:MAG: metallophosphoesterase [Desulfuromonadaceae bacterium]|nr:metallophosphoesterase [Desulfuromonadaceae bacterium]
MARYAIGDIHGGVKTFRALLDKINLSHEDTVYLLGDYVDRGQESKGVLDTILDLLNVGFDIRPIKGNHDDLLLKSAQIAHYDFSSVWYDAWGRHTLASFGVENPGQVPAKYLTLLDSMPSILVEDDFVFVHAALDMAKDDPINESSEIFMLWGEVNSVNPKKIGFRTVVTGHTIQTLPAIEIYVMTNRIYLDNGAFTNLQPDMGNLVALNLDSRVLIIHPWIDGPTKW